MCVVWLHVPAISNNVDSVVSVLDRNPFVAQLRHGRTLAPAG